jgi:hypothetical protein
MQSPKILCFVQIKKQKHFLKNSNMSSSDRIPAIGSRVQVWNGNADHTKGGLRKSDLVYNAKTGRIVSREKRRQAIANRKFKNSAWIDCIMESSAHLKATKPSGSYGAVEISRYASTLYKKSGRRGSSGSTGSSRSGAKKSRRRRRSRA